MAEDAKLKLDVRLVPAEGEPDPALLDDLIRLIKQAVVTAPPQAPQVSTTGEFYVADDNSQNALETKIKHRIEQASADSQAEVQKRAELAKQPDGEAKLATEALEAARNVVSAVQRTIIRGVEVRVSDAESKPVN